jgi:hypothetical protein
MLNPLKSLKSSEDLLKPAGRSAEIFAGVVLAPFALIVAAFALIILASSISDPARNGKLFWVGLIFLGMGAGLILICWRLFSGRAGHDGGLFSPLALRIAGIVLAAFTILVVWWTITQRPPWSWWILLKIATLVSFVIACFKLAAQRAERPRAENAPIE